MVALMVAEGYTGSEDAIECVTLTMSPEEVAGGDRRAEAFVATNRNPFADTLF